MGFMTKNLFCLSLGFSPRVGESFWPVFFRRFFRVPLEHLFSVPCSMSAPSGLFFPLLSLSVLGGKTDNIFGSWNAFGIFAGFSALMSLLVIEFFPITMLIRWMLQALIVLSLVLIAAVNLTFVWEILGISSLIIFVYKVSSGAGDSVEE